MPKRSPAPPGAATAARVFLLAEVWRQRVRWTVPGGPALRYPRTGDRGPLDVTRLFGELLRARWVAIEPWDQSNPPAAVGTLTTEKGDDVLLSKQARRTRRKTRPTAAKRAPAVRRVTYRPPVLRELHAAGQWLRKHRPTSRRLAAWRKRTAATARAWPGRLAAALRRAIVAERVGGHYRKHKPKTTSRGRR